MIKPNVCHPISHLRIQVQLFCGVAYLPFCVESCLTFAVHLFRFILVLIFLATNTKAIVGLMKQNVTPWAGNSLTSMPLKLLASAV